MESVRAFSARSGTQNNTPMVRPNSKKVTTYQDIQAVEVIDSKPRSGGGTGEASFACITPLHWATVGIIRMFL
jgi:hypothetical protein